MPKDTMLAPESLPFTVFWGLDSPQVFLAEECRDPMGPQPGISVQVLADLGLSVREIARYFGVPEARVRRLTHQSARQPRPRGLRSLARRLREKLRMVAVR